MRTDSGMKAVAIKDKKVYPYHSFYYTFEPTSVSSDSTVSSRILLVLQPLKSRILTKVFSIRILAQIWNLFGPPAIIQNRFIIRNKHIKMCREIHTQDKQISTQKITKIYLVWTVCHNCWFSCFQSLVIVSTLKSKLFKFFKTIASGKEIFANAAKTTLNYILFIQILNIF